MGVLGPVSVGVMLESHIPFMHLASSSLLGKTCCIGAHLECDHTAMIYIIGWM